MFAISKGGLLVWAAVSAGLALSALGFGAGAAAAAPWQPSPADIPFLPTQPDPDSVLPTGSGLLGLPSIGGLIPLITDTTHLLSAGSDPNALMAGTQSLLNDAGSLLGVPVGMPNVGSFIPPNGVPNVPAPLAPSSPLTPPTPLAPLAPPAPVTPLAPPTPVAPPVPFGSLA